MVFFTKENELPVDEFHKMIHLFFDSLAFVVVVWSLILAFLIVYDVHANPLHFYSVENAAPSELVQIGTDYYTVQEINGAAPRSYLQYMWVYYVFLIFPFLWYSISWFGRKNEMFNKWWYE